MTVTMTVTQLIRSILVSVLVALLMPIVLALNLFVFAANANAQGQQLKNEHSESVVALSIENMALSIDQRISGMKMLANTIANDAHIHEWVASGFVQEQEGALLNKLGYLVQEYGLTSASFADTKTHKYWNHEGFLRVLVPEIDTWYFAYLESGKQDLMSVYHDKNKKRVDLYVNYKQADGAGLSGIATSFDGVVNMLVQSSLNEYGTVFIVDSDGKVQVHSDPKVAGKLNLQQLYSTDAAKALLQPHAFNHFKGNGKLSEGTDKQISAAINDEKATPQGSYLVSSYIPSMNWFIVAQLKGELY